MRAIWIDLGNDADYARLKAHDITEPIYDIRDPRVTKPYLDDVRSRGFQPGVYAAWNWPEVPKDPAGFAEWVDAKVKPLHRSQNAPSVHLNDETHDPVRIVKLLKRWRELRPSKRTVWTFEGHQGGLFDRAAVSAIDACNVILGPQSYTGSMERFESSGVVIDLIRYGFKSTIEPLLDAADLGLWWSGTAYTQGRLA